MENVRRLIVNGIAACFTALYTQKSNRYGASSLCRTRSFSTHAHPIRDTHIEALLKRKKKRFNYANQSAFPDVINETSFSSRVYLLFHEKSRDHDALRFYRVQHPCRACDYAIYRDNYRRLLCVVYRTIYREQPRTKRREGGWMSGRERKTEREREREMKMKKKEREKEGDNASTLSYAVPRPGVIILP